MCVNYLIYFHFSSQQELGTGQTEGEVARFTPDIKPWNWKKNFISIGI